MTSPRRTLFLLSAYVGTEFGTGPDWLRAHSSNSATSLTEDPQQAEAIVFLESHPPQDPYFVRVLRHPLTLRHPEKVVLYHDADRCITALRTISPNLESWQYDPRHKRAFHYLGGLFENAAVQQCTTLDVPRRHLFSFVGSVPTHPLRSRLLHLDASQGVLRDTGQARAWLMTPDQRRSYEATYLETLLASRFILCPRGIGPTTYRLFEAMRLARAPVIISDAWVPVEGVAWDEVSIRISEAEVERIPSLLRERAGEAEEMGLRARAAWERCFAPEVTLDRLTEAAVGLLRSPYGFRERFSDLAQFRSRWHLRNLARFAWNRLRSEPA